MRFVFIMRGLFFIYVFFSTALLSGTLRTYQKATCDDEWMSLRCPTGTTLSIQLAQYGKVAPSPALCTTPSSTHPDLFDLTDPSNNVTCLWPPAIQVILLNTNSITKITAYNFVLISTNFLIFQFDFKRQRVYYAQCSLDTIYIAFTPAYVTS